MKDPMNWIAFHFSYHSSLSDQFWPVILTSVYQNLRIVSLMLQVFMISFIYHQCPKHIGSGGHALAYRSCGAGSKPVFSTFFVNAPSLYFLSSPGNSFIILFFSNWIISYLVYHKFGFGSIDIIGLIGNHGSVIEWNKIIISVSMNEGSEESNGFCFYISDSDLLSSLDPWFRDQYTIFLSTYP